VIAAQEEEAAGNLNIDPHTVTKMLRVRKLG
jgi:Mn-dependent DtxR family transcriptional regulator